MKKPVIISFILALLIFSGCGKSKQELVIGEWEIKSPKKPNFISALKLNPDHTGILIKPHALIDIKEIPVNWLLDGDKLIMTFQNQDGKEVTVDTVEVMNVSLKILNIKKGIKEDYLVRIR
jgi:hypothetical protein